MQELVDIKSAVQPPEILFVADAMTGQDAVTVAEAFNKDLALTGVVLTKMDGDARGGAALSIKSVTGASVKSIGVGEKLSDLEVFHPERVAGRILGMGDMLTLIEKAQSSFEAEEAEAMAKKLQKATFDFEDFRTQMRRMKKIGSLENILKLIPGLGGLTSKPVSYTHLAPAIQENPHQSVPPQGTQAEREAPQQLFQPGDVHEVRQPMAPRPKAAETPGAEQMAGHSPNMNDAEPAALRTSML